MPFLKLNEKNFATLKKSKQKIATMQNSEFY